MYLQFLVLYREKVIDFFIINFHIGNSNQKLTIRYLKTLPPPPPPQKKARIKRPFSLPKAIASTKVPTSYHLNFFKYILNCPVNNPRIRFWAIHGESLATAGLSICKSSSYKYSIDQIQSYYPNEMRNRYVLLVVHYSAKHTSYSNKTWKNLS